MGRGLKVLDQILAPRFGPRFLFGGLHFCSASLNFGELIGGIIAAPLRNLRKSTGTDGNLLESAGVQWSPRQSTRYSIGIYWNLPHFLFIDKFRSTVYFLPSPLLLLAGSALSPSYSPHTLHIPHTPYARIFISTTAVQECAQISGISLIERELILTKSPLCVLLELSPPYNLPNYLSIFIKHFSFLIYGCRLSSLRRVC